MIKNRKMYAVLSPFFLLGFLVMTLLATPALTVYSADVSGSLTVIQKDAENKAPLADVELSIYQVASYKDNTFHTAHLTPDFVKSGIDLNESMTADKQYDLALELNNYIQDSQITSTAMKRTSTVGEAKFDGLSYGIYLVRLANQEIGQGTITADPFLVSIPMMNEKSTEWIYDVVSQPKATIIPKEEIKPLKIKLNARKTLDGETPKGSAYTFILRNKSGDVIQTKNNKEKSIDFDPIQYTKEGKYIYTIEEWANPNFNSIIFDDSIYQVTINVNQRDDKLVQSIKYNKNGEPYSGIPVFENKTVVNPTPTPDIPNDSGKIPQTGQNFLRVWFFISLGLLMIFTGYRTWLRERTYYEK